MRAGLPRLVPGQQGHFDLHAQRLALVVLRRTWPGPRTTLNGADTAWILTCIGCWC